MRIAQSLICALVTTLVVLYVTVLFYSAMKKLDRVDGLELAIVKNTENIRVNARNIAGNTENISNNAKAINVLTELIKQQADINARVRKDIDNLASRVGDNTSLLSAHDDKIKKNTNQIGVLTALLYDLEAKIETLETTIMELDKLVKFNHEEIHEIHKKLHELYISRDKVNKQVLALYKAVKELQETHSKDHSAQSELITGLQWQVKELKETHNKDIVLLREEIKRLTDLIKNQKCACKTTKPCQCKTNSCRKCCNR